MAWLSRIHMEEKNMNTANNEKYKYRPVLFFLMAYRAI